jgi:hypothetical protein
MSWWAWLLIGWIVVASIAALWLGAAARVIKRRERAARSWVMDRPARQRPSRGARPRLPQPRDEEISEALREEPRR